MIKMTEQDLKHYLTQRVIPELQHEGFDSSLDSDRDDDSVTLTIQRNHHYYSTLTVETQVT